MTRRDAITKENPFSKFCCSAIRELPKKSSTRESRQIFRFEQLATGYCAFCCCCCGGGGGGGGGKACSCWLVAVVMVVVVMMVVESRQTFRFEQLVTGYLCFLLLLLGWWC